MFLTILVSYDKKMLQFVELKQETPVKRDTSKEKLILMKYITSLLLIKQKNSLVGVSRGVPFCQIHCPLSNNIPTG